MKAVILHPEIPEEATIDDQDTLIQMEVISEALTELGYEPTPLIMTLDIAHLVDTLTAARPVIVFNLVEALIGRGSLIHMAPAILDSLQIPYTGASTEAMFLTSNKVLAKKFLKGARIATPPWVVKENGGGAFRQGRYIVKSIWEHASIGICEGAIIDARSRNELLDVLASRKDPLGGRCFAERFVDGREFSLSVLAGKNGPQVLPPVEIRFEGFPPDKPRIISYEAKWDEDSFEYQNSLTYFDFPEEDGPLLARMKEVAARCWHLFNLRGYARVDIRVDKDGNPWVLEVNANPCLAPDGGFAWAVEEAGLRFRDAIERIIGDSLPGC